MTAELRRRLARLEATRSDVPSSEAESNAAEAMIALVEAYHLGGWRPGADLLAHYRAACAWGDFEARFNRIGEIAHMTSVETEANAYHRLRTGMPDTVTDAHLGEVMDALPALRTIFETVASSREPIQ